MPFSEETVGGINLPSSVTLTEKYDFADRLMRYVESGSGYSHSVGYTYDLENNLTSLVETINGVDYTTFYTQKEAGDTAVSPAFKYG